jgi:3-oxoacyl-[acyl-carrier protein] reductase
MILEGKVALVTGASGGIGAAVAQRFAAQGARLLLAGRDRGALEVLASNLSGPLAPEVLVLDYDVRDDAAIAAAFRRIRSETRRLDVLVNNAGVMLDAPLGMISRSAIDEVLQVNLVSAIGHLQYAARLMAAAGGGSIVNMSSIVGVVGSANQAVYAASKAAIIGLTLSAAKELAPKAVRVNALAPGFIDTAMTSRYPDAVRSKTIAAIGLGRPGTAAEVAQVAAFLASDLASYVTGQVVGVDGGLVL